MNEEEQGRRHIAEIAELQRRSRGAAEFLFLPRLRWIGRKLALVGIWVWEVISSGWRRIKDPNKWPGRWWSRVKLLRPQKTLSVWTLIWISLAVLFGLAKFSASVHDGIASFFEWLPGPGWIESPEIASWLSDWGFGGAVAIVVALLWHDALKSPYYVRRARRRVIDDPELLRQPTLSERTSKILELEPPVNTVPRDELYEELLPGAISARRDVQIVMGVPGAGKTTALLDLATVLAKIGLMPVLLEMRGELPPESLYDKAKERFEKQVRPLLRTAGDADVLWRWMCARKRVAILIDDIDQISFDGEPGFAIRGLLESLGNEGQTVIVTARPAGVPVGIAASAVTIGELDFDTAVNLVERPVVKEPGATAPTQPSRGRVERWVRAGRLTESPLYLEALAEMNAVGACPDLPDDPRRWADQRRPGRWSTKSDKRREWTELWVRYLLLSRFYERIADGRVRRRQGIDRSDRERSLRALEGAALGLLGASGLAAKSNAEHREEPKETRKLRPRRTKLVDFISSDDRRQLDPHKMDSKVVKRRREVSQHEAIDTGERLRILDRDWQGEPQFRHRIMQAYLAGRRLAELARLEREGKLHDDERKKERVKELKDWVETLTDSHHPEKLTAHLALVFAALHADEGSLQDEDPRSQWDGIGEAIAKQIFEEAKDRDRGSITEALLVVVGKPGEDDPDAEMAKDLDPLLAPDPGNRFDYDDDLIKLTTVVNIVGLLCPRENDSENRQFAKEVLRKIRKNEGATRWTKLEALRAIPTLDIDEAWKVLWEHFTSDLDYDVREAASHELERNACRAYPPLQDDIERRVIRAGARAAEGQAIQFVDEKNNGSGRSDHGESVEDSIRTFRTLGWVLPAIVSGLSEELHMEGGAGVDPGWKSADGQPGDSGEGRQSTGLSNEECLKRARKQLENFTTLAFEGDHHELEESLAQGFKADAWRHAYEPSRGFTGPGWVASNRRLVADVALPNAESWYARMLLHQALALYAVAGTHAEDTLDVIAHRLHLTRERHPLVRQAAKLSRKVVQRTQLGKARWKAFVWSDDVEDGGRLPTALSRRTAQLVGDVAVLVDLKEGAPPDRHVNFGHMEELPYCFRASRNRYEILGEGCPPECGWGFCPYRAASPDEPNEHRGVGRGFCRAQRRAAKRSPAWQRGISKRKLREFWKQMEYKARR